MNIKKPLFPIKFIKIEQRKGPPMAPKPKANCKLAPAATNLSLVI